MYPNLKGEMAKKGVTIQKLSLLTNIPYSSLAPKLRGKGDVNVRMAKQIKEAIGTNLSIDVLFSEKVEE